MSNTAKTPRRGQKPVGEAVAELHREAISGLRAQLRLLRRRQVQVGDFDTELAGQYGNLSRALAALTAEVRKREVHVRDLVGEMSQAEKIELVMGFITLLPPEQRAAVRARLDELDAEIG